MDYKSDISKYTSKINDKAIEAIVRYCGIALQTRDASLVSCTDTAEIDRVRKGFATKILGLGESEADKAIATVCEKMKADNNKHRVTFYYLLAEAADKMDALA
jgi:Asp/Glu/hydantoin racemase